MQRPRYAKGPKPVKDKRPPRTAPTTEGFSEIASRSTKVRELKLLWRNAKAMGLLTDGLRTKLKNRAEELRRNG